MRLSALLAALLLTACDPPTTPVEPAPSGGVTDACVRSFRPTLEAWEAANGRVPDVCAYLDTQYTVELVPASELPCVSEADNELVVACTQPEEHAIYLLEGRDQLALLDSSVHEWLHAIEDCAHGDRDREHLRAGVWTQGGAGSVEVTAQAAALTGTCLAAGATADDVAALIGAAFAVVPEPYRPLVRDLMALLYALGLALAASRPLLNRLPAGTTTRWAIEWVDRVLHFAAANSTRLASRIPHSWVGFADSTTPAERPSRKPGARGGR